MNTPGLTLLPLVLAAYLVSTPAANAQTSVSGLPAPRQWPTSAWAQSSPEAQGMRSSDLADALEFARMNDINIHSLMVVRNGFVVLDAYFYPFTREMRHDVASVTKSITSLLVDIATADGYLMGVEQPVVSALPKASTLRIDQRVARIRIGDLLAMESGFDCGFRRGEPELRDMRRAQDWVRYALRLPVVSEPGTRFGYCSPNFHLLSAAIATATKMSTLDYARGLLFVPLGIDDVHWPADRMGFNHGWGDLQLHPLDMAKIGLLMLHGGQWEDRQIVPKAWIDSSLKVRATVNEGEDCGLGWWLSRRLSTLFEAIGRGGQRISVVPEKNLVVVMTGGGFESDDIGSFVLSAVRADTALPEDPNGQARLADALRSIATPPKPHAVRRSATAKQISHRLYSLWITSRAFVHLLSSSLIRPRRCFACD